MSFEYIERLDSLLRRGRLDPYSKTLVYEYLSALYMECDNDVTKIKKRLRELGYFVPHFVIDKVDGQPIIKKFSRLFYLDGVECYTNHTNSRLVREFIHMGYTNGVTNFSTTAPHEITQRYATGDTLHEHNLSNWITYGEICECGNHYITTSNAQECSVCAAQNQPMPYSTRAEDLLGHEETKDLKVGIELEYEGVFAKDVLRTLKGHAIAKSDGTIGCGVEVVTRPACIKTHKESLKGFFSGVKTKAYPNTGMHIHVEKSKISQYQIGFMLWFVNNEENYPFLMKVAGRDFQNNRYAGLQKGTKMTSYMFYDDERKKLVRSESGKYVPLNTNKTHTYEFRIFRSPESHLEMSAKLDFVKALIDYASPYACNVKTLKEKGKSENFVRYIASNKKQYPDFVSFFKEMF